MDSTDCITDTPTSNHMVFDQQITTGSGSSVYEAGTEVNFVSGSGYPTVGTAMLIPNSGKWYWEIKCTTSGGYQGLANSPSGVIDVNRLWAGSASTSSTFANQIGGMGGHVESGFKFYSLESTSADFTIGSGNVASGDWMVIALDMDNGKGYWGWYDTSAGGSITWFASDGGSDGNPSTGANPTVTFDPKSVRLQVAQSGYAPGSYPGTFAYNFGSRPFNFTAPTDFIGLSQDQFPETGDFDFIPDLVWTKNRDQTDAHAFYDSSRGIKERLKTDSSNAEAVTQDGLQKFLKGGYETLQNHENNAIDESYVTWMWKAGGGTTSANTDGSGATVASQIQANQDAGFSIVTWTGNNTSNTKIAHGLTKAPEWILIKNRDEDVDWWVYHHKLTADKNMKLNTNDTEGTFATGVFDHSGITNKVFEVDNGSSNGNSVNGPSDNMIAYCWHGIEGYSKFGSYVGNGSSTLGQFVYTGIKPALIIIKGLNNGSWLLMDRKRDPFNSSSELYIEANTTAADAGGIKFDMLSNGFMSRDNASGLNSSGVTYIYAAFAEHPFVGTGTNPVSAF